MNRWAWLVLMALAFSAALSLPPRTTGASHDERSKVRPPTQLWREFPLRPRPAGTRTQPDTNPNIGAGPAIDARSQVAGHSRPIGPRTHGPAIADPTRSSPPGIRGSGAVGAGREVRARRPGIGSSAPIPPGPGIDDRPPAHGGAGPVRPALDPADHVGAPRRAPRLPPITAPRRRRNGAGRQHRA